MTSKIKCTHCDTQKTAWCSQFCEHAKKSTPPKPETVKPPTINLLKAYSFRSVLCVTTGNTYKSLREAGQANGMRWQDIRNVCTGFIPDVKGLVFRFVEGYEYKGRSKMVKCHETGDRFSTVVEAALHEQVPETTFRLRLSKGQQINGRTYEVIGNAMR